MTRNDALAILADLDIKRSDAHADALAIARCGRALSADQQASLAQLHADLTDYNDRIDTLRRQIEMGCFED